MTAPTTVRPLSPRQAVLLRLIADGVTNRVIAHRLNTTEYGVKNLAARLYRQLGARDRAHAVAIGFRTGLLSTRCGSCAVCGRESGQWTECRDCFLAADTAAARREDR